MKNYYDVIVIGAGPAGCISALTIKSLNPSLKVKIIEKSTQPTHKIGEILLTQTMVEFENIGIIDEIIKYSEQFNWQKKYGVVFVSGTSRTPLKVLNNNPIILKTDEDSEYPQSLFCKDKSMRYTFIVKRHEFDWCLREIAKSRGVEIEETKVVKVNSLKNEKQIFIKSVDCENGNILYATQFIDCSGQASLIARDLNCRKPLTDSFMGKRLSSRYAYFKNINFNQAENKDFLKQGANIISFEGGWLWLAATENNDNPLTSIGIVSDDWKNSDLYSKFKKLPELKTFGLDTSLEEPYDYLGNKQEKGFHYSVPDYSYYSEIPYGVNWVCCGDASIFIDPLLSQGVTLAISYSHLYGKAIVNSFDEPSNVKLQHFESVYKKYILEKEIIVKLLESWYNPEIVTSLNPNEKWVQIGKKLSKLFKKDITEDMAGFQLIINLENVHMFSLNYSQEDLAEILLQIKEIT